VVSASSGAYLARSASAYTSRAARTAASGDASGATGFAALAAKLTARASADRLAVLIIAATLVEDVLIDMDSPGAAWLDLCA
jgi:hypothetical protein